MIYGVVFFDKDNFHDLEIMYSQMSAVIGVVVSSLA